MKAIFLEYVSGRSYLYSHEVACDIRHVAQGTVLHPSLANSWINSSGTPMWYNHSSEARDFNPCSVFLITFDSEYIVNHD